MPVLRSGIRLLSGAFRTGLSVAPGTSPADWLARGCRVLSFDIFDTLLERVSTDPFAARRSAASQVFRLARRKGNGIPADTTFARWCLIEQRLKHQILARGGDPEVGHREVLRLLLAELLGTPAAESDISIIAQFELDREFEGTAPRNDIVGLARAAQAVGMRVIAMSDSWYSAIELQGLLERHRITEVKRVYSSSDWGESKFTGRLFRRVYSEEEIQPTELLHVGDHRLADDYSARAAGSTTLHVSRFHRAPVPSSLPSADPAFVVGATLLGPALAYFAHVVLLHADRDGTDELAFVARDGDLLLQVARTLQPVIPVLHRPALRYVFLSRRSTALPNREVLGAVLAEAASAFRPSLTSIGAVFESVNLDPEEFLPEFARAGLDAEAKALGRRGLDASVKGLLDDPVFREKVDEAVATRRRALRSYLEQEGFFRQRNIGLVDIGWKGTTEDALHDVFGTDPSFASLRGYYLGLWADPVVQAPRWLQNKEGLVTDFRRQRTTLEGAAWYLAMLFESVCRASHGPVVGYSEAAGQVTPILLEGGPSRQAEESGSQVQARIRDGVLWAAARYMEGPARLVLDEASARHRVQRILRRLAFFPTAEEVAVLGGLSHTETVLQAWSTPLIQEKRVSPYLHPMRWLPGLQSPWRAGYVAATGGWPLSVAFIAAENCLLRVPPSLVRQLRSSALRMATPAA